MWLKIYYTPFDIGAFTLDFIHCSTVFVMISAISSLVILPAWDADGPGSIAESSSPLRSLYGLRVTDEAPISDLLAHDSFGPIVR